MEPWKMISLLPPPVLTTAIIENIDVVGLRHICNNIIRVLSKQSPLHREGAIMSRLVYKYDKKFRNDIGYKYLKKTNSTLRKYLHINLLKDVENFTAVMPNMDDDFLPARQMLEYILSRIITLSKLMVRIYVCSKQAAVFYLNRVKSGENHWMSLMPYALLSRIWSICAVLLDHTVSWYSSLYPFLTVLQPKGLRFLPEDYELPTNLEQFIELNKLDTFGKLEWSGKKVGLALPDDETDILHDNILNFASFINVDKMEKEDPKVILPKHQQLQITNVNKVDCGQVISRDSYRPMNPLKQDNLDSDTNSLQGVSQAHNTAHTQQNLSKSCEILSKFQKKIRNDSKHSHYFGRVTNAKSLKDFLNKEEELRNDGNEQSLTLHLSFMQWHTLKTSLLKVCESVLNDKKIDKKLQKVWKAKCLDYNM